MIKCCDCGKDVCPDNQVELNDEVQCIACFDREHGLVATNESELAASTCCDRCGHPDALKFAICLVNVDEESFEEGSHVADVDARFCSECEEAVADLLLVFKRRVLPAERIELTPAGRDVAGLAADR